MIPQPPPIVLSSGLVRAWATAQILSQEAGWPEPKELVELEPGHVAEEVAAAVARVEGVPCIALVGHEPQLSLLASHLIAGHERARIELKKGGALCLAGRALRPRKLALRWLLTPEVLQALT
jgi:phosphohistidine phosphatase SixA